MIHLLMMLVLACSAQLGTPSNFLVKLSRPVNVKTNKAGDSIRAAIISPERLLNGYLEGRIEQAGPGVLTLRFDTLLYKGKSTAIQSEVVGWVNSKGHKNVDDDERPMRLQNGAFRTDGPDLWLDEGAELRLRATDR